MNTTKSIFDIIRAEKFKDKSKQELIKKGINDLEAYIFDQDKRIENLEEQNKALIKEKSHWVQKSFKLANKISEIEEDLEVANNLIDDMINQND